MDRSGGTPAWLHGHARAVAGVVVLVAVVAVVSVVAVGGDDTSTRTTDTSTCTTPAAPTSTSTSPAPSTSRSAPGSSTTTATTTPLTPTTTGGPSTVLRTLPGPADTVALTFDAGSDPGSTARILDLLASHGASASFGLTGCWVDANPSLARRIAGAGHTVVNHTQDHLSFTGYSTDTDPLSAAERTEQVREAEQRIRAVTGSDPQPWFRPPFGDHDQSVLDDVGALGYTYTVMWSLDSLGWKGIPADDVADRVIAGLEPGAIILMHVGEQSTDVDALPSILDAIEARALRPVSLAQVVGDGSLG